MFEESKEQKVAIGEFASPSPAKKQPVIMIETDDNAVFDGLSPDKRDDQASPNIQGKVAKPAKDPTALSIATKPVENDLVSAQA